MALVLAVGTAVTEVAARLSVVEATAALDLASAAWDGWRAGLAGRGADVARFRGPMRAGLCSVHQAPLSERRCSRRPTVASVEDSA